MTFLTGFVWLNTKEQFSNPPNCLRCGYRADCEAYWSFCPYTGEDARLKRADGDCEVFGGGEE